MERETGVEPATSSLGINTYVESKSLARFCCVFLNLQRLAESAKSDFVAQTRHERDTLLTEPPCRILRQVVNELLLITSLPRPSSFTPRELKKSLTIHPSRRKLLGEHSEEVNEKWAEFSDHPESLNPEP
jgi:hypothetical protein